MPVPARRTAFAVVLALAAMGLSAPVATAAPGSTPPDSFWGDTGAIPPAQNVLTVKVLNRTNGKYPDDQVYWSFNGQTHSIAEQPTVDMGANSSVLLPDPGG